MDSHYHLFTGTVFFSCSSQFGTESVTMQVLVNQILLEAFFWTIDQQAQMSQSAQSSLI